ncbi:MAG: hypothetical protein ABIB71_08640 [Candidatus Woesearchaeota archaeon]
MRKYEPKQETLYRERLSNFVNFKRSDSSVRGKSLEEVLVNGL